MHVDNSILKIKNLTTGYGKKNILRNINLELKQGEICTVIGEEGAGKSTLLKALTGQLPFTGAAVVNGLDLQHITTDQMTRHHIDFIMQGGNILKNFTVKEHIELALAGKTKTEKSAAWAMIDTAFPKLATSRNQVAGMLSGGERIILSIGAVMATDAQLLILDEPTAGLAPETCKVVSDFLNLVKHSKKKTVLLLEHNIDFAFDVADSLVVLKEGKLSQKYSKEMLNQIEFINANLYGTAINYA